MDTRFFWWKGPARQIIIDDQIIEMPDMSGWSDEFLIRSLTPVKLFDTPWWDIQLRWGKVFGREHSLIRTTPGVEFLRHLLPDETYNVWEFDDDDQPILVSRDIKTIVLRHTFNGRE